MQDAGFTPEFSEVVTFCDHLILLPQRHRDPESLLTSDDKADNIAYRY
jgi:hypothetical protein